MEKILNMMKQNREGAKPAVTQPLKPPGGFKSEVPSGVPSPKPRVELSKGDKSAEAGKVPPFIDPSDLPLLERHLKSPPKTMEVEVSFGLFNSKFIPVPGGNTQRRTFFEPGVSVSQFNSLLHYLSSLFSNGIWASRTAIPELEITLEEADNRKDGPRIKKITDSLGNVTWLEKQRHTKETIDNETWGYRISKSTEKINQTGPENFIPNFWRRKERRTFFVVPRNSAIYGVQFDLTVVRETKERFDNKTKTMKMCTDLKYEVEIERKAAIEPSAFENAIAMVIKVFQRVFDSSQIMTMPEREYAIAVHNNLFLMDDQRPGEQKKYDAGSFYLNNNYWNKPENIKVDDMLNPENKFAVTLKVDGVRRFLLITSNGIYSCLPPLDVWKVGGGIRELDATLLDTEVYTDESGQVTYFVFDILFYRGQDVRKEYFTDDTHRGRPGRLSILKDVCPSLKFFKGEMVQAKNFYYGPNLYENVELAFNEALTLEEEGIVLDGLIFQSHVWYKNFFTKKWKPSEKLTIDFKLSNSYENLPLERSEFVLLVKTAEGYAPFMGSRRNPIEGISTITLLGGVLENVENTGGLILNPPANGIVVECRYDSDNKIFVPVRYRDDKEEPNFIHVAGDVWDDIVDPISKEDIMGHSLFAMRRFHNLIKKHFLEKEFKKGDQIMDWGSGRGGDIKKWKDIGLETVFVVEPNEDNFAEFERRVGSMKIDRPQIVPVKKDDVLVGAEETETILENISETIDGNLNGIVSFFSLTFFGRDSKMFNNMIETIDKTLPVGGKFLGIVMDGERVQSLLEQDTEAEEDQSLLFDCPSFRINQISAFEPGKVKSDKNEIEITIKEATSMVDQNEWLFYFSVLRTSLEKIGFELKYDGFLDEEGSPLLSLPSKERKGSKTREKRATQLFNLLNKDGKTFSSLNRYFMFVRKRGGTTASERKESKTSGKVKKVSRERKSSKLTKLDDSFDIKFNFLETYWESKVPESESINRDFFLIRPVPTRIKYNFIHSVLYALDSKYRALTTIKDREKRVYAVLRMMAKMLTLDLYNQLIKGPLYDLHGKKNKKVEKDEDQVELEYAEFRVKLVGGLDIDGNEYSDEMYSGILSHLLKINIMTIEISGSILVLDSERQIFGCYDNTIVIVKLPSQRQYDVLADAKNKDKVFTAYSTRSPFIKKMIEKIAASKKNRGATMKIKR